MEFLSLFRSGGRGAALALLLTGVLASPAAARQQADEEVKPGAISGRVVDAQTGANLAGIEVAVLGTSRSALTDANGQYRVGQLLPGKYRVQARSVGYRSVTRTVEVGPEQTVPVRFEIVASAVPLDEVVVVGQPGPAMRREVGHSVATIHTDALVGAPIHTTSQLLQSRVPGVLVQPSGGKPGQASRIIMRGVGSFMDDAQPVILLDGVRIDNSRESGFDIGGNSWWGLDDINPDDIERIEISRGGAAAILYGAEAGNGVLNIHTKKGRGGKQHFTFRSEYGNSSVPEHWWDQSRHGSWFARNMTDVGRQNSVALSVRGAVDRFGYYASASRKGEAGVLPNSHSELNSFRANMRVAPRQDFHININTGFAMREVQFPFDGEIGWGMTRNALLGGFTGAVLSPVQTQELEVMLNATRFTAGASFDYAPLQSFTHRLTVGADFFNSDNTELHPYGTPIYLQGKKANFRRDATTLSVDYTGSIGFDLSPTLRSTTSFGFQAYSAQRNINLAAGENFVGAGLFTVRVTGTQYGDEDRVLTRSSGFYLMEQLGYNDRLYLDLGARLDGHSAFGRDHRYHLFPRVGASYILSDHGFLPEFISTLRLRTAYGAAGRPPADFVATRSWTPIPAATVIGLTTGNFGNRDLGPEVSHEFEAGFDAALLRDRVGLEFTAYDRRTTGVIYPVYYAPSGGWTEPRFENVGEIDNRGIELVARATVLNLKSLRWNTRLALSANRNRVLDLAGNPELNVVGGQWIREGYPVGAFFKDAGDYIGPSLPTRGIQLGSDLTLKNSVNLTVLLDHQGGHYLESYTKREIFQKGDPIANPIAERGDYVFGADFWRLREVGVTYTAPAELVSLLPFSGVKFSVSGRNLWRSQSYRGLEAEAYFDALRPLGGQTYFDTPLPRQFVAGLSIEF